jgi:hypothetical protein
MLVDFVFPGISWKLHKSWFGAFLRLQGNRLAVPGFLQVRSGWSFRTPHLDLPRSIVLVQPRISTSAGFSVLIWTRTLMRLVDIVHNGEKAASWTSFRSRPTSGGAGTLK